MAESKFLIKYSNVDRTKYVYSQPVTTKNNTVECKCEYMRDNEKTTPFFFESPRLFTASKIFNIDSNFYLDLIVPMTSPFLDWLLAEDDKNIQTTVENSESWFNEQTSTEEITQGYKASLTFRAKADPVFRVNIPSIRGKPQLEVYDNNKQIIDMSKVVPGVEVACIMEKMPLRFYRDKFTGEYLIYKLKVCSNAESAKLPSGYIFADDDDVVQPQVGSSASAGAGSGDENTEDEVCLTDDDSVVLTEDEEDPLAVSGDESSEHSGDEDVEDPLAVSGDEEDVEDPLAVSGDEEDIQVDEEEEDPLTVSGDEDDVQLDGEEEDPLAVSGDEEEDIKPKQRDGEEEDPLAVSGDEEEDATDNESVALSEDSKQLDNETGNESEFGDMEFGDGGADEETTATTTTTTTTTTMKPNAVGGASSSVPPVVKPGELQMAELTESDLEL